MLKLTEAFKRIREETHPEDYAEGLPSFNWHLARMIRSGRYVFSSDFLARGYALDRRAAEKLWLITCEPDVATDRDISMIVFKNNPDTGLGEEEIGIWLDRSDDIVAVPHDIDVSRNPDLLSDASDLSDASLYDR